ncbi:TIGR03435 family protein [Terriglobus roseus]|uniref:TIGR03435 family protein n=1 Tax=Terriglobus roseus TaxID=392734 RepID=UPI0002DD452C
MLRFAALLAALITALPIAAQTPIKLDVIAIHPHKSTGDDPSNRQMLPGGRLAISATSVHALIRIAFGLDDDTILNEPEWARNELFDINATTVDRAEVKTPEQFQQVMLSLLQNSFGFRYHRQQRQGQVYWLVLSKPGKLGPALKASAEGTRQNLSMNGDRIIIMRGTAITMPDLAASLRRRAGRRVEDHTGLTGAYDLQLRWTSDDTAVTDDLTLPAALNQSLGLKLQSARGNIEDVSVDNLQQPSND